MATSSKATSTLLKVLAGVITAGAIAAGATAIVKTQCPTEEPATPAAVEEVAAPAPKTAEPAVEAVEAATSESTGV